ncbi:putative quinol monooxygenase [Actinophytocola glycyrrhizae]|uniref:Quinol monooxygenase n=1 Tax=Actinophytocola glycyrrhizae TaxID=2044873 RepID=A0ABV9RST8_9PSEU
MSIFVRGRFDARDGRRAEFEEIALALAARAADEPGTRTYRWLSAGEGSYIVIEEYVDEAAAMAHNEGVADLLTRVPDCAELVLAEVYGPSTLAWAEGKPRVTLHPDFSG